MSDLTDSLDKFAKDTKSKAYHNADKAIKSGANAIRSKLPKPASPATLYSFADYRYSNRGRSRNLSFKIATKKGLSNYTFSAYLGDDQNLAHLFEDGFDLKQRHGTTHINPLMDIDFETESDKVARNIVNLMNKERGGD